MPVAWVENLTKHARFPTGNCVMGGYLWGISQYGAETGVLAFNGTTITEGGKLPWDATSGHLWTDGTRLYHSLTGTVVTVTVTGLTGSFVQGEQVTQATSGAVGFYIRTDGDGKLIVALKNLLASFDNSHVISGATASATATAVATASAEFLAVSPDGWTDFKIVLDVRDSMYPRSFVSCGVVGGKTLNLAFDRRESAGGTSNIYYNVPEDGDSWTVLGTTDANAIRHFHGAVMIGSRLVVMTGDEDAESSILVCDDVADLIANWATWKTRWGLDKTGAARTTYLTATNTAYNYGCGNQVYRTVDVVADAGADYGYYLPDQASVGGPLLRKIDLAATVAPAANAEVGATGATGEGGIGLCTTHGTILLSTFSYDGTHGNGDDKVRLYAVVADDIVELSASAIQASTYQWFQSITQYPATGAGATIYATDLMGAATNLKQDTLVGTVYTAAETPVADPAEAPANLIEDGKFRYRWSGTDFYAAGSNWTAQNITTAGAKETTIVDADETLSLKIAGSGTPGADYYRYAIPESVMAQIRGRFVTLRYRYYWPAASTAAFHTSVEVSGGASISDWTQGKADAWQTSEWIGYVNVDAPSAYVEFRTRTSGTVADPVYVQGVALVDGARRGVFPDPFDWSYNMAAKTWVIGGGNTGAWDTDGNWVEGSKPATGDDVTLPVGSPAVASGPAAPVAIASLTIPTARNAKDILTNVTAATVAITYSAAPTAPAITGLSMGAGTIAITGGTWSGQILASCTFTGAVAINITATINNANCIVLHTPTISAGSVVTVSYINATVTGNAHNVAFVGTIAGSLQTVITGGTWSLKPNINGTTISGSLRMANGIDCIGGNLTGATITCDGNNGFVSTSTLINLTNATITANGDIAFVQCTLVITCSNTVVNVGGTSAVVATLGNNITVTGVGSPAAQLTADQAAVPATKRLADTTLGGVKGTMLRWVGAKR